MSRIHGKDGKIYLDVGGRPIEIASKTEWTLTEAPPKMNREEEKRVIGVLGALLKRAGGEVTVFTNEWDDDNLILFEEVGDAIRLTLVPDYVHHGFGDPDPSWVSPLDWLSAQPVDTTTNARDAFYDSVVQPYQQQIAESLLKKESPYRDLVIKDKK